MAPPPQNIQLVIFLYSLLFIIEGETGFSKKYKNTCLPFNIIVSISSSMPEAKCAVGSPNFVQKNCNSNVSCFNYLLIQKLLLFLTS